MPDKEMCKCPFCNRDFKPEDGLTPTEHLAKEIIRRYSEMQNEQTKGNLHPCPRCGLNRMKPTLVTNALSRVADVYICDDCGTDEAIRELGEKSLPITNWVFVSDILKIADKTRR